MRMRCQKADEGVMSWVEIMGDRMIGRFNVPEYVKINAIR